MDILFSSCRVLQGFGERRGVSPPVRLATGGLTPAYAAPLAVD
jgi:hypothetical protein